MINYDNEISFLDFSTVSNGEISLEKFNKFSNLTIYQTSNDEEILQRISKAQAVFINKIKLNKEILQKAQNLKYIGLFATGYDNVDLDFCKKAGISVCNVPRYSTFAVAQLTIALMLNMANDIIFYNKKVKEGCWENDRTFALKGNSMTELYGKTFGIIGLGNIGKRTALIASSLGMNVIAYDHKGIYEDSHAKLVSMEELLSKSDVISLHCPLKEGTRHIINNESISKMKDGVMLINTSRGGLINEEHLRHALDNKKVYFSSHDVFETEPSGKDNLLISSNRTITTPHIGWMPQETRQRAVDMAYENYINYLEGKPSNKVN